MLGSGCGGWSCSVIFCLFEMRACVRASVRACMSVRACV